MNPRTRQALIRAHSSHGKEERRRWDRFTEWYLGDYWGTVVGAAALHGEEVETEGSEEEVALETNFAYAFIDTMIANVAPSNPSITVTARREGQDETAKHWEALANGALKADRTHELAWRLSTTAAICGRGITKTVWSAKERRPKTYLVNPRNFAWDRSVPFDETSWVMEVIPVRESVFKARAKPGKRGKRPMYDPEVAEKAQPGGYPAWLMGEEKDTTREELEMLNVFRWILVYEIYDFETGKFYHVLEDVDEPLLEDDLPYDYFRNPYDLVAFNWNTRDEGGLSDIQLIKNAQERLNEVESLELKHVVRGIPQMLMNPTLFDDASDVKDAIVHGTEPGSVIDAPMTNNTIPITHAIAFTQTPALMPNFGDIRERILQIIQFVLGIPEYTRGGVGASDVATELALADTATRTRNGRRIKVLSDWVASVAFKIVALWGQFMAPDETIPVLVGGSQYARELDVTELGFDGEGRNFQKKWWFEFEAVPYSPTENHKLVVLQKLAQYMDWLAQNPHVDQAALIRKLLEHLGMQELFQEAQAQGPGGPGAPAGPGQVAPDGMPSGTSADSLASGATPEGTADLSEALLPPNARALADQPGG